MSEPTQEMIERAQRAAMLADAGYDISQQDYIMALGLLAIAGNQSATESIKAYWRLKLIRERPPEPRP